MHTKNQKSHGARSGEYPGWGSSSIPVDSTKSDTSLEQWAGAPSCCNTKFFWAHSSGLLRAMEALNLHRISKHFWPVMPKPCRMNSLWISPLASKKATNITFWQFLSRQGFCGWLSLFFIQTDVACFDAGSYEKNQLSSHVTSLSKMLMSSISWSLSSLEILLHHVFWSAVRWWATQRAGHLDSCNLFFKAWCIIPTDTPAFRANSRKDWDLSASRRSWIWPNMLGVSLVGWPECLSSLTSVFPALNFQHHAPTPNVTRLQLLSTQSPAWTSPERTDVPSKHSSPNFPTAHSSKKQSKKPAIVSKHSTQLSTGRLSSRASRHEQILRHSELWQSILWKLNNFQRCPQQEISTRVKVKLWNLFTHTQIQTCFEKKSNYAKVKLWQFELSEMDLYSEMRTDLALQKMVKNCLRSSYHSKKGQRPMTRAASPLCEKEPSEQLSRNHKRETKIVPQKIAKFEFE